MPRPKGQIKRLKNGVWLMRVETNKDGVRRSKSKRYASKEKAETALESLLAALNDTANAPTVRTFDQLFDAYLEIIAPTLAEQTYYLYERIIKLHLRPAFGKVYLSDLSGYDVEKFYAKLQKTLSGETIFKIHNQLKASLVKSRFIIAVRQRSCFGVGGFGQ